MSHSPTWIKEMLAHLKSKGPFINFSLIFSQVECEAHNVKTTLYYPGDSLKDVI